MMGAAHDKIALSVIRPAHHGLLRLHPRHQPVQRAYAEGLRFRAQSEAWAEDRKRAWVLGRLREVLRQAAEESAFYRDRFRECGFDPRASFDFAEFASIPPLTRADIHDSGPAMLQRSVRARDRQEMRTGGSTGRPVTILTGPRERGWRKSGSDWAMTRLGVPPGTRKALLWAHHLDPVASTSMRDRLKDFADNRRWFDCLRLSPETLGEHHSGLESYRPACLIAYSSALAELAEFLEQRGITPQYPTVCSVTGAEKLYAHQRALIERVFAVPVYERYGSRDVGDMAFETRQRELVVDWPLVLVEPGGAGPFAPILVTKLQADAMPMIRYEIGDVARFPRGLSAGKPAFSLHEVGGRVVDRISMPGGQWVHGCIFPHLLKDYPIQDFQIHQHRDFSVRVRVVPRGEMEEGHVREIRKTLEANLPGTPISIETAVEIERPGASKWRPVTSDIPVP